MLIPSRGEAQRRLTVGLGAMVLLAFTGDGLVAQRITSGPAPVTHDVTITSASPTIVVSGLAKGDRVQILATLTSDDPNEGGEGEPLIIQGSNGFSATDPDYELAHFFVFIASSDSVSLTAFIKGADGDESARIRVTVPSISISASNSGHFLSQTAKDDITLGLKVDAVIAAGAGAYLISPQCAAIPGCKEFVGAFAAGVVLTVAVLDLLVYADPADPNYKVIATPNFPTVPKVALQPGITQDEIGKFEAVMHNLAQQIGYTRAAMITFDRAAGASAAGAANWIKIQRAVGFAYLHSLGKAIQSSLALRALFVDSLYKAGFPTTTITPNQVMNTENTISQNGLPKGFVGSLRMLGAGKATIGLIKRLMIVQDKRSAAGLYLDKLVDPSVTNALQLAAAALIAAPAAAPATGGVCGPNGCLPPSCAGPSLATITKSVTKTSVATTRTSTTITTTTASPSGITTTTVIVPRVIVGRPTTTRSTTTHRVTWPNTASAGAPATSTTTVVSTPKIKTRSNPPTSTTIRTTDNTSGSTTTTTATVESSTTTETSTVTTTTTTVSTGGCTTPSTASPSPPATPTASPSAASSPVPTEQGPPPPATPLPTETLTTPPSPSPT